MAELEGFAFLNRKTERIELLGSLISWSDDVQTGIVEHRVMKQDGALHQNVGAPPARFEFQCVLLGKSLHERIRALREQLVRDPFGQLIHPRFGLRQVVFDGLKSQETPGEMADTATFTLRFSEDQLRDPAAPSATAAAAAARAQSGALVTQAQGAPQPVAGAAAQVDQKVTVFESVVADLGLGSATLLDLAGALRDVDVAAAALRRSSLAAFSIKAQAALVLGAAIAAYDAAAAGRPRLVPYRVPGLMSVAEIAVERYGARHARAMALELMKLQRIPRPYAVPAGFEMLIPSPAEVRANAV
jgi:hypothetical protein